MFILILIQHISAIQVQVNNIRPYNNPSETYSYYTLKFCEPEDLSYYDQTLGQSLSGDQKMNSVYHFTNNTNRSHICTQNLQPSEIKKFEMAIKENYYAEFYIGDLRIHDRIGFISDDDLYYLKNHLHFNIYHNKDKFLHANISDSLENDYILLSNKVDFYFSASFIQIENVNHLDDPYEKNANLSFYWDLIIIKGIIIIFLCLVVSYLFKQTLQKDFIQLPDEEDGVSTVAWKAVKIEALLPPKNKILLSALLGNGVQFLITLLLLLILGIFGIYEQHRGTFKSVGIIIYSFIGVFNGYYSGRFYKFFGGKNWGFNLILCLVLVPISIGSTTLIMNAICWAWGTTVISFSTLFSICFITTVVYLPLTIIGGVLGRLRTIDELPQKREKKSITNKFNYRLYYGLIPFMAIIVELHILINSTWGHYLFHQYLLLLFSYLQLIIIIGCLSIIQTYRQLNQMDYNWQWSCIINGGSASMYILIYLCAYFYFVNMHGFIQFLIYFTYNILSCLIFWLILGTISYIASLKFVIFIYSSNKLQ